MILVDTSVWSLAFRRSKHHAEIPCEVKTLHKLIEDDEFLALPGIVLQELLSGLREDTQFKRLGGCWNLFRSFLRHRMITPARPGYQISVGVREWQHLPRTASNELRVTLHTRIIQIYKKNKEDKMSKMISAKIPDNLAMMFEIFIRETQKSESFHIQKALEPYLEDYADLKTAQERLRNPSDPVISIEEMRRKLDI